MDPLLQREVALFCRDWENTNEYYSHICIVAFLSSKEASTSPQTSVNYYSWHIDVYCIYYKERSL